MWVFQKSTRSRKPPVMFVGQTLRLAGVDRVRVNKGEAQHRQQAHARHDHSDRHANIVLLFETRLFCIDARVAGIPRVVSVDIRPRAFVVLIEQIGARPRERVPCSATRSSGPEQKSRPLHRLARAILLGQLRPQPKTLALRHSAPSPLRREDSNLERNLRQESSTAKQPAVRQWCDETSKAALKILGFVVGPA